MGSLHDQAAAAIRDALADPAHPYAYVSCSGGKDSMLLTALVIAVDPDVPVVHSTHGARHDASAGKPWLPDHWPHVLAETLRGMGARNVHTTHANLLGLDAGWDLTFVGLRRSESARRRARMDARAGEPLSRHGVAECWPLEHWSTSDVWDCTDAHQVPWASVYRRAHSAERMHWPVDPADRADWARLRYHRAAVPFAPRARFTRDRRGAWAVLGPVDEVVPGPLHVLRRDGSVSTAQVLRTSRPFVGDDGTPHIYGYLDGALVDQSAPKLRRPKRPPRSLNPNEVRLREIRRETEIDRQYLGADR